MLRPRSSKPKEGPYKVIKVITKASREYKVVEDTECDQLTRRGSNPGRFSAKVSKEADDSWKGDRERSQTSITCHQCGVNGYISCHCSKMDTRGGGSEGKSKDATSPESMENVQCGVTSGENGGARGQHSSTATLPGSGSIERKSRTVSCQHPWRSCGRSHPRVHPGRHCYSSRVFTLRRASTCPWLFRILHSNS